MSTSTGRIKRRAAIKGSSKILNITKKFKMNSGNEDNLSSCYESGEESWCSSESELEHDDEESEQVKEIPIKRIQKCGKCNVTAWNTTLEKKYHLKGMNCPNQSTDLINCTSCEESFTSQYELEIHEMSHGEQIPFECPVCHNKYLTSNDYEMHVRESSCPADPSAGENQEFECDKCGKVFKAKYLLLRHRITYSKNRSCELCGRKNRKYDHFLKHTNEIALVCDICKKPMKVFKKFKRHRLTHIGNDCKRVENKMTKTTNAKEFIDVRDKCSPYECHACKEKFKIHSKFKEHMIDSECPIISTDGTDFPKFKCTDCAKMLKTEYLLLFHKATRHNSNRCPICNSAENDIDHYLAHTGEICCICDICGKPMLQFEDLQPHRSTHMIRQDEIQTKITESRTINEIPIVCKFCNNTFTSASKYLAHFRKSKCPSIPAEETVARKIFECEKCRKQFKAKYLLLHHRVIKHLSRKCDICNKQLNAVTATNDHFVKHTKEIPCYCDICGKPLSLFSAFRSHRLTHTGKKRLFRCEYEGCSREFTKQYVFNDHLQEHRDLESGKSITCYICQENFTNVRLFRNHLKSHSTNRQLCNVCGKTFKNKILLDAHSQVHNGYRYPCTMCDRKFCVKNLFNRHYRFKHLNIPKQYGCNFCEKRFITTNSRNNHIRLVHTGERPFQCEICGDSFHSNEYLHRHMDKRHSTRKFECQICKKSFTAKIALCIHRKIHQEKKYKCNICQKSFTTHVNMISHMRSHTGEKPYQCDECGKTFSRSDNLNTHVKMHAKDKNGKLKCETCGDPFANKKNLSAHRKTVHGITSALAKANKPIESENESNSLLDEESDDSS